MLNQQEQRWWQDFKTHRLQDGGNASRLSQYFKRIAELSGQSHLDKNQKYLLGELSLYGQSVMPIK
ncbi:hypothetical protein HYW35_01445 [Candidatus Saccharibacteria bacterium]|nr:hypothetical protein [Candidatus Saccharibacteria bacterium]